MADDREVEEFVRIRLKRGVSNTLFFVYVQETLIWENVCVPGAASSSSSFCPKYGVLKVDSIVNPAFTLVWRLGEAKQRAIPSTNAV